MAWQDKLKSYGTDKSAAQKEIERAKSVYTKEKKSGATKDRLSAVTHWADQVRSASGIGNDDAVYGNNIDTYTGVAKQPNAQPNAQQYIDQLNDAQKKSALAGLDKSRNQALSNLQEEKAGIKPRYYDARNQTAAGNQQQARNFAEFMAARGGARSGANAQAEISQQGTLQSNLGTLNRQENTAFDNIGRRTTDVNNAYETDVQSANSAIEAQRMQALISQMNTDKGFGLQEAGLTGQYNGQQTLGGQQLDLQRSGQEFNQGMAGKQFDLQRSREKFNQGMETDKFGYQQQRDGVEDQKWEDTYYRQGQEFAQRMGYDWASLDQRQKESIADEAWREKSFDADQMWKFRDDDLNSQGTQSTNLKPYTDQLNELYLQPKVDKFGSKLGGSEISDPKGLRGAVLGLNLNDEETGQLLSLYGLGK